MANQVLTTEEAANFFKITSFTVRDSARRRILSARRRARGGGSINLTYWPG
jgi:hypothetical protein